MLFWTGLFTNKKGCVSGGVLGVCISAGKNIKSWSI